MDDDLRSRIAAAWERGAATYDREPRHGLLHDEEWIAWRRLLAAVLGDPLHAAVPRLRVLDVGTGTGVVALLAAELGHEVTAIDASPAMLEQARAKARERDLVVDWRLGDAETLPVGLTGFDAVVARQVLWTLPHPARALAAWRDAARPGGLVVVLDGWHEPWPLPLRLLVGLAAHLGALVRPRQEGRAIEGHDYDPATLARLPLARLSDPSLVIELLRGAGLEHVRFRRLREIERVERRSLARQARLLDRWRRFLASGRVPHLVAEKAGPGLPPGLRESDGLAYGNGSEEPSST